MRREAKAGNTLFREGSGCILYLKIVEAKTNTICRVSMVCRQALYVSHHGFICHVDGSFSMHSGRRFRLQN